MHKYFYLICINLVLIYVNTLCVIDLLYLCRMFPRKSPLSGALCLAVEGAHLFHFLVHLSQTRPTQMSNMRSTVIIYYPNAS